MKDIIVFLLILQKDLSRVSVERTFAHLYIGRGCPRKSHMHCKWLLLQHVKTQRTNFVKRDKNKPFFTSLNKIKC